MVFQDLTRQRFNKLVVLKYIGKVKSGQSKWLCQCDCGQTHEAVGSHLKTGNIKSCGCLNTGEARSKASMRHGGSRTPEYESYHSAKKRCNNPNALSFADYGGRGIEFRFTSFEEFLSEVGPRPEPKFSYSLERKDNNAHYEPGNVKWATKKQQALNRRCNNCAALKQRIAELERTLNGKSNYRDRCAGSDQGCVN
jgi:hypothetical protein